jgi:plastocyanin
VTLTVSTKIARAVATTGDVLRRAAEPAWLRVLALASVAGMAPAAETPPVTHTVVMRATSYAPLALTMKLGDMVVWRNEDPFPHTATAAGVFDSKSIAAGASWKYRPEAAGEYAYICTFHPNMKGTLKVE